MFHHASRAIKNLQRLLLGTARATHEIYYVRFRGALHGVLLRLREPLLGVLLRLRDALHGVILRLRDALHSVLLRVRDALHGVIFRLRGALLQSVCAGVRLVRNTFRCALDLVAVLVTVVANSSTTDQACTAAHNSASTDANSAPYEGTNRDRESEREYSGHDTDSGPNASSSSHAPHAPTCSQCYGATSGGQRSHLDIWLGSCCLDLCALV